MTSRTGILVRSGNQMQSANVSHDVLIYKMYGLKTVIFYGGPRQSCRGGEYQQIDLFYIYREVIFIVERKQISELLLSKN